VFKLVKLTLISSKSQIDSNKMFLHEAYCLRNNKYCNECKHAVEVATWDEHVESHKVKKEPTVIKPVVETTNNIKPIVQPTTTVVKQPSLKPECQYCSLQLSQDEVKSHELNCGSRSAKCEYCNTTVILAELKTHYILCDAKLAIDELQNEAFMEDQFVDNFVPKEEVVSIPQENDDVLAKKLQMELDERLARE
jgi:hypothetical protein